MTGVNPIRDLRIAVAGARRALNALVSALEEVEGKSDAVSDAADHDAEENGAEWAANGELLLTPQDVAKVLRVSVPTLARWRCAGTGPAYVKRGGRVLYKKETIANFVIEKERTKTRGDE